VVVSNDISCLMHIGGMLRAQARHAAHPLHARRRGARGGLERQELNPFSSRHRRGLTAACTMKTSLTTTRRSSSSAKARLPACRALAGQGEGSVDLRRRVDQAERRVQTKSFSPCGMASGEFGGIEPNPRYETCMKAVELVRAEGGRFSAGRRRRLVLTAQSSSRPPCLTKAKTLGTC